MPTRLKAPTFNPFTVRQLYGALLEGRFAIPRLQREFVWNGSKAAKLLDSVYRQMPIGALTIWEAPRSQRHLLRHALHVLPPHQRHHREIWFVIDGQQRLSVLYQAFQGERRGDVDFSRLSFAVAADDTEQWFAYRKPDGERWVALKSVLSRDWRRQLRGLPRGALARVERCRAAVLGYKLPAVFVSTKDLDGVRELFIRINSLGTPIGAADRAFAFASVIDLRDKAREVLAHLAKGAPGYASITDEVLLQAFALAEGETDVGERSYTKAIKRWERDAKRHADRRGKLLHAWNDLAKALERAVQYLRTVFGIEDWQALPSSYMVALLTLFFHRYGHSSPTPAQKSEIRKWFWATGVGQRYSGRGFRENIVEDARFFVRLARGKARFHFRQRVDPSELRRTEYQRQTALGKAVSCLLVQRLPAHLNNGDPIPQDYFVGSASKKNRHHIFPQRLLANHGFSARERNSLCNICLLTAEENQSIGAMRPAHYLGEYRRRRHFGRFVRSHLLPPRADSGLWDRNIRRGYRQFLKERLALIRKAFDNAAGIALFRKEVG